MNAARYTSVRGLICSALVAAIGPVASLPAGDCPNPCPEDDPCPVLVTRGDPLVPNWWWPRYPDAPEKEACCGSPIVTGNDAAAAFQISASGTDTDRAYYHPWTHNWATCQCYRYTRIETPSDPVVVNWAGSVDLAAPGQYTLTATFTNPSPTPIPGSDPPCYQTTQEQVTRTVTVVVTKHHGGQNLPTFPTQDGEPCLCNVYVEDSFPGQDSGSTITLTATYDLCYAWVMIDGPEFSGCNGTYSWSQTSSTNIGVTFGFQGSGSLLTTFLSKLMLGFGFIWQQSTSHTDSWACSGTACTEGMFHLWQKRITLTGNFHGWLMIDGEILEEQYANIDEEWNLDEFKDSCQQVTNNTSDPSPLGVLGGTCP